MCVMSLPMTMAFRPCGYSGVMNSMDHATMPIVLEPVRAA